MYILHLSSDLKGERNNETEENVKEAGDSPQR